MYDETNEPPAEDSSDPALRAREKAEEFRMHAELAAVFEGPRKFDNELIPGLDGDLAREIQRTVGKLEKARVPGSLAIAPTSMAEASGLLDMPGTRGLSAGDYHIHRRPGEVQIVRWLAGEEVDTFYQRLQAHFDAALDGFKEDERQAHEWKHDSGKSAFLRAVDAIQIKLEETYYRPLVKQHGVVLLSTQTADDINIAYLCDYIMGVSPAELVGSASAPPAEPTEQDLGWFFKLFLIRGLKDGVEQMCFFTFLQKTDDSFGE